MRIVRGYLVVNTRGNMRVVKTKPSPGFQEVAFLITVQIPEPTARPAHEILIRLPEWDEPEWELTADEVTA